jgi:hypothetical protein
MKHGRLVCLAALALTSTPTSTNAQCKSGQQRQPSMAQQQNMLQQQLLMRTQQQQFNTLINLQQPQQSGLVGTLEQQPQNPLLLALKKQRQQNSLLIAPERKQRNTYRSYQTGRTSGFATAVEDRQFADVVQTALQQTATLLSALDQANVVTNQNAWRSSLQQQSTALADLAQLYGSSSSD